MALTVKDNLTPELKALAKRVQDTRPVLEAMGLQLVSLTQRAWNDPALRAAPWPALKPATVAAKKRAGKSDAILKRNALLWRSWRVARLTKQLAEVGTDRPYAPYHQFGTPTLPARPMLPFTGDSDTARIVPSAEEAIHKVAEDKLRRLLRAQG